MAALQHKPQHFLFVFFGLFFHFLKTELWLYFSLTLLRYDFTSVWFYFSLTLHQFNFTSVWLYCLLFNMKSLDLHLNLMQPNTKGFRKLIYLKMWTGLQNFCLLCSYPSRIFFFIFDASLSLSHSLTNKFVLKFRCSLLDT